MSRSYLSSFHPDGEALPGEMAQALDEARHRLGPFAGRVRYFSSVGSTNDVASSIASASGAARNVEGTVIVADLQTAGRGRLGRTWFSPAASGLYVSVILTPNRARVDPARATMLLTMTAGVALAEAVEAVSGLRPDVKWPNDLYVARRKLAGILAEAVATSEGTTSLDAVSPGASSVVLGYGINVGSAAYPPELAHRATSLESELGRPIDRAQLFAETLSALARRYADLLDGEYDAILDRWRRLAPSSRGTRVGWTTPSGPQSGITDGVDGNGALLVKTGERIERIVAGELTWF